MASLKNQLAQLDAHYVEAERNYRRVEKIKHSGAISMSEVDQRRAAFDAAKAERENAVLSITRATLVAPVSGLVYQRAVNIGTLVGSGDALFRIAQAGQIELVAEVAEADLGTLKAGQSAHVHVAGRSDAVEGKIRLVSPRIDEATRTAALRISLPNKPALAIGTFADAEVDVHRQSGLALPQTAITLVAGKPMVWLVDASNMVHARPIETGLRAGGLVLVMSEGLGADVTVVAKAGAFLREGDAIIPVAATAPRSSTSSPSAEAK